MIELVLLEDLARGGTSCRSREQLPNADVYATLHGPFAALGDDSLLAFRHSQKHLHPLRKRDEATLTELTRPVSDALDAVARLHVG